MSAGTALFLWLTNGARETVASLARSALAAGSLDTKEARWALEVLAGEGVGMLGSHPGASVLGMVTDGVDDTELIADLSPFLLDAFRADPTGRALVWCEAYEASGAGAIVTEL